MRLPARLFLFAVLFSAAVTAMVGLGASRLLDRQLEETLADRLSREASVAAERLARQSGKESADELASEGTALARRLAVRVTFIDPVGRVLYDSGKRPDELAAMENHLDRREIALAASEGVGRATRHSASVGIDFLYVARRIDRDGSPAGFVRFAIPLETLVQIDSSWRELLLALSAAALLASVSGAAWLALRLSRPVSAIRASALAIAGGDLASPIDTARGDEIGDLARAVARMRDQLLGSLERAERERRRLDSMVSSLEEGVMLVDADLAVTFANGRAREILDLPSDPTGRPLIECLRLPEGVAAFREALAERSHRAVTLRPPALGGRSVVLELRVVPVEGPEERSRASAVGLFLDMTRIESLERVRQQFVADLSHELRTPITSAKAAAETLCASGAVPAELGRFPEILLAQTRRMEELVDDLTDLSLIETGSISLELEPLPVANVAREQVDAVLAKWSDSGVAIAVEVPEGLLVQADRRRLGQVVSNLLDNAVKFSPRGETVMLRAGRTDSSAWIEVEDRGIGIPLEEQEKVFQRFYQVDRSRSKSRPGSGLGLAIVRHLVLLQGGRIELRSVPGEGSRFRVELPLPA